jgi:nitrous oxidase accessory protein
VAVMFSKNIVMKHNAFRDNWGQSTYGLLLKEISDGVISDNYFYHNTTGLLGEGANRLIVERNTFRQNGIAMDIKGNCLDNEFRENDYLSNTFEVVTNSRRNNNVYDKNYWGQYRGYDLDRDGYGDEPYRPVNIFGKITNEIPSATILLHSFFVDILNLSEKVLPTIIPKELVDSAPKMKPHHYDHN